MNQKGLINIILVVIVVALVGAGVYFVLVKKQPKLITQQKSVQNNLSNFCLETETKTQEITAKTKPDTFISQSQNKEYLEVWKEIFIHFNGISNNYFNDHIRIETVFVDNTDSFPLGSTRFIVHYYFVTDWATVRYTDQFLIKNSQADKMLGKSEIISIAKTQGELTANKARWRWSNTSGSVENISSIGPTDKIVFCQKAVEKLIAVAGNTFSDGKLTYFTSPLESGKLIVTASFSNPCYHATVSLISGEASTKYQCPIEAL